MERKSIVRCAHRGASAEYPENTILAFRRALDQGVDALELDIHRTADDKLVVIHDSTLERTTNGKGRIRDHRFDEIRQLDAGQGEKIPTLMEVIELARAAQVRLCVEIKGDTEIEGLAIAEGVVQTLENADILSQSILTSFSPQALLHAKGIQPEASTMLDPSPQDGSLTPREICAQTLRAGANCLSYDFHILTQEIAAECQLTGLALWAWAPDEPADIQKVLKLGVQGIVTNMPAVLNKVLNEFAF